MSRKRKPVAPATPITETTEEVKTAMNSVNVNSTESVDKITSRYGSQGTILPINPTEEEIVTAVEEVFEKNPLTPLPITNKAGLEMFDEAVKKQISDKVTPMDQSLEEKLDKIVSKEPSKWEEESNKRFEDELLEDDDAFVSIKMNSIIGEYSTLLEFYQAKKCIEGSFLDFIPLDYVDMDEESGIIKSINFAFMIPFDVIKGETDYCTLAKDQFILENDIPGIPSRYDIVDHGITKEVRFNVEGEYEVKSLFDSSLTVLQSSLLNNHKIVK